NDLHLGGVAGGKGRADGAVDRAGREALFGVRPTLPFGDPAGKLARGVGLLAVIDRQREEVAFRIFLPFDGGHQDHRVAQAYDDGPMSLFGDFSGFDTEGLVTEGTFDSKYLHGLSSFLPAGRARGWDGKEV